MRIQKHLHPHKFLKTHIRNVQRKWQKDQGSTVFFSHIPKCRDCDVCLNGPTCTMDKFVPLVVPELSSFPEAARLQHWDQKISPILPVNRNKTDADRSWPAGLGKPWTSTQRGRDEQGGSNARNSRLGYCGEGEDVSSVHTLLSGVVQVCHELLVDEEEEKEAEQGWQEKREVERERRSRWRGQGERGGHVDGRESARLKLEPMWVWMKCTRQMRQCVRVRTQWMYLWMCMLWSATQAVKCGVT